jgi:hypothetical protein
MKLSSLTPTDKIKLAAELDGFEYMTTCKVTGNLLFKTNNPNRTRYCPDYATSYDAIIPLIQKQSDTMQYKIFCKVGDICLHPQIYHFLRATPSQLLDALLIATGRATL